MNFRLLENILCKIKKNQSGPVSLEARRGSASPRRGDSGFTLIELLIYAVIFTIASGLLTGILVTISGVQTRENAAFEVTRQLQFVTQKIQYTIRDSSIVDAVYEGSNPVAPCTTFCTVKLRVANTALDPTIISSDSNGVYITEGAGARQTITSPNVKITSLVFNKVGNPGGLSTVTMDIALFYNTPDPTLQIAKSLSSAIAHVSAATFDTDLLPDASESRSIGGSSLKWKDITVSNGITVSGAAGVGEFTGLTMAKSTTHGTTGLNEYYVTGTPYDKYGARFDVGSTPMLYLEGDINQTGRRAYFLNGNVGIGTSSPANKLEVYSGSDTTQILWGENIRNAGNAAVAGYGSGLKLKLSSDAAGEVNKWAGIVAVAGNNYANQTDMAFYVNPTSASAPVEKMRLTGTGWLGIGVTPSYALDVSGDLRITGTPYRTGGDIAWQVPSDIRLKDITGTFNYGLSDLNKLNVVTFKYKEGNALSIPSDKEYDGLIAQEVQKVIPEAVSEDRGYLTLNSTPVIWTMLNSIKELSAKVDEQKATIDELNSRIDKLEGK